MQTLYAFMQCKKSDYHVAMDLVNEKLTPGFDVIERPSDSIIEGNKRLATNFFKENYLAKPLTQAGEKGNQAEDAAVEAINFYHNLVKKDFEYFSRNMLIELERLEDIYLLLLLLPQEFVWKAQHDDLKQDQRYIKKNLPPWGKKLTENQILTKLQSSQGLAQEASKRRLSWSNYSEKINGWYLEIIKKDETFNKYVAVPEHDIEEDKKLVNYLFKSIILKHEFIETHFEETGVRWDEDKEIIKGMLTKTLKSVLEDGLEYDLELFTRDDDWEEEKSFYINLFRNTVSREDELEELISVKTKNWDIERIALLDKIILKMALTEMIIFPGIPVKVTINEYLEIAKRYSTPKSRQFINGLLDNISGELINNGVIKKSGRGLIDNK